MAFVPAARQLQFGQRPFAHGLGLCLLLTGLPLLYASEKPLTEKQKIDRLIQHVENMKDTTFVRNDKEYDARTAAKFLRGKWQANETEIKTARDFIDKVARASSTSGKPYRLRFKDGKEVPSRAYLLEELEKLEKSPPQKRHP